MHYELFTTPTKHTYLYDAKKGLYATVSDTKKAQVQLFRHRSFVILVALALAEFLPGLPMWLKIAVFCLAYFFLTVQYQLRILAGFDWAPLTPETPDYNEFATRFQPKTLQLMMALFLGFGVLVTVLLFTQPEQSPLIQGLLATSLLLEGLTQATILRYVKQHPLTIIQQADVIVPRKTDVKQRKN